MIGLNLTRDSCSMFRVQVRLRLMELELNAGNRTLSFRNSRTHDGHIMVQRLCLLREARGCFTKITDYFFHCPSHTNDPGDIALKILLHVTEEYF